MFTGRRKKRLLLSRGCAPVQGTSLVSGSPWSRNPESRFLDLTPTPGPGRGLTHDSPCSAWVLCLSRSTQCVGAWENQRGFYSDSTKRVMWVMIQEDIVTLGRRTGCFSRRVPELQGFNKITKCQGGKDLSYGLAQPSQKGKLRPREGTGLGQGPPHTGQVRIRTQEPWHLQLPPWQQATVSMLCCGLFLTCHAW